MSDPATLLDGLEARARYTGERYERYKARAYGPRLPRQTRMRA